VVYWHCFLQDPLCSNHTFFLLVMLFSGSLIGFQLLAFFTQNFPFIVPSLSPSHLSLLDVSPFVELGVVAGLFSSFRET